MSRAETANKDHAFPNEVKMRGGQVKMKRVIKLLRQALEA